MKTKFTLLSALTLSLVIGSSVAQARFDFDSATGDSVYGRSKYQYYYNSYLQACGSYETKDQSSLFGDKEVHEVLYPQIGQMHAELEQVRGMRSGSRQFMNREFAEAKRILDIGYEMKDLHADQLTAFGENTSRVGGQSYLTHAEGRVAESHVHLDRSMRMKREDAHNDVLAMIKEDAVVDRDGLIITPSSFDRWQECKSYWSYADRNRLQHR